VVQSVTTAINHGDTEATENGKASLQLRLLSVLRVFSVAPWFDLSLAESATDPATRPG